MATLTVTIDDAKLTDILNAFVLANKMPTDEVGAPIYPTNAAWAKAWIRDRIKEEVAKGKRLEQEAARDALDQTETDNLKDGVT